MTVDMSCMRGSDPVQYLTEDIELITGGMFTGYKGQDEQDGLPWTERAFVWLDLNQLGYNRNLMKRTDFK